MRDQLYAIAHLAMDKLRPTNVTDSLPVSREYEVH